MARMAVVVAMLALLVGQAFGATSFANTGLTFASTGVVLNSAQSNGQSFTAFVGPLVVDASAAQATQNTASFGPTLANAQTTTFTTSGRRLRQAGVASTSAATTEFAFATDGLVAVKTASGAKSFVATFPGVVNFAGSKAEGAIFTLAVGPTDFVGRTVAQSASGTTGRKLMQSSTATAQTFAKFVTNGVAIVEQGSSAKTRVVRQSGNVFFTDGRSEAAVLIIAVGPTAAEAGTQAVSSSTSGRKLAQAVSAGVNVAASAAFIAAVDKFGVAFAGTKTFSTAFKVGAGTPFEVNVAFAAGGGVAGAITGPKVTP